MQKIVLGLIVLAFVANGNVFASKAMLEKTQSAFNQVAEEVYPSVVSITTAKLEKKGGELQYVPFKNASLDQFVSNLFGYGEEGYFTRTPTVLEKKESVSSGIIIRENGFILTNFHPLEGVQDGMVSVKLSDGEEYPGEIVGIDSKVDLALIKIQASDLKEIEFADSDKTSVGSWAIAIGNPYGFIFKDAQPTMTVGVISALNRSLPAIPEKRRGYEGLIQTDAAINLGNSGGPLVNIHGELVGINVAIVSTTGGNQGIGFAVPSNAADELINHFIDGQDLQESWVGIDAQDVSADLAQYYNLDSEKGAVVLKVLRGGPAAKAGLKDGDILTGFNGKEILDVDSLLMFIEETKAGKDITFDLMRNGRPRQLIVVVGRRPSSVRSFDQIDDFYFRGLRIEEITDGLADRYNLPHTGGVVITDVKVASLGERAGLLPGDVIVKVGQEKVRNFTDFFTLLEKSSGDILFRTTRGYFVIREV